MPDTLSPIERQLIAEALAAGRVTQVRATVGRMIFNSPYGQTTIRRSKVNCVEQNWDMKDVRHG